jgi:Na+/proline symporter
LSESAQLAGKMGKMNLVNFSFDLEDKFTFWSGITGGLFLALSYFGTDQSQVGRYLSGKSVTESRLGLLFNGLLKIPMQFLILFIGILVFVFYQFNPSPVFFNKNILEKSYRTEYGERIKNLEDRNQVLFSNKKEEASKLLAAIRSDNENEILLSKEKLNNIEKESTEIKKEVKQLLSKAVPGAELKDTDYVFLTFVMNNLPIGMIGLLLAVILCAAMSSTSSELNALASTSLMDLYKRSINKNKNEKHYLNASRWLTIIWGLLAILFSLIAPMFENLIQMVNWLGSIFYGTILGVFICGFFFKYIQSNAVFIAAIIAQISVIACDRILTIGFLWYNVIGCFAVIVFAFLIQMFFNTRNKNISPKAK